MDKGEQTAFRGALGETLRELREARGLSLEDAASAAGVTVSRLRAVEAGKRDPWFTEVIALARLHGVDPDAMLIPDLVAAAAEGRSRDRRDQVPMQETTNARRRTE